MTTPIPGPAASVLSAILVTDPDDPGSPLSRATFSQSGQAPLLPSLTNDVVVMPQDGTLDANGTWTGFLSTLGLPGATAPTRWVGSTAAGAPTQGTFSAGDFITSQDGNVYVCITAGTPGTWTASGGLPSGAAGGNLSGTYPNPTVAKINGVAVTGTPSAGMVPTATSSTAATWQAGGTLPLTTLGDILYENATPAAARLAGNTAATKNFLTQTGNGTISAAPAWGTLAAGDLPAATSGANGAVRLTGDLGNTATSPQVVSTHLSAALPRAQGGTGVTTTPAAPVQYAPADPTATASGPSPLVMMGLGSTCTYTPASSGNIKITVTGTTLTNTAAAEILLAGRYGTGTAPANGAALAGTRFGSGADRLIRAANFNFGTPFTIDAVISLTPSTAYWFDIALATGTTADTAQVNTVGVAIFEIS